MKKRIVFITEYFFPAQRNDAFLLTKIAKTFAKENDVHVISTTQLEKDEELDFIKNKVFRLNSIKIKSQNKVLKALNLMLLTLKLFFKSLFYLKKGDSVFTVTNPVFMLPFLILIKKIKKFELTLLVYDVFPDNLEATRILNSNSFLLKFLKKIFNWSYSNADKLIVIGRDMEKVIEEKTKNNVPIVLIENWCDYSKINLIPKDKNSIIKKFNLEEKIVFSFVGNFGLVQGIQNLLDAASLVKNEKFSLLFIGSGAETKRIEKFIKDNPKNNVIYAGKYPSSEQNTFLNACDVSIMSLDKSMYGLGVPSKSYYNMAAEKPLLYIGHPFSEISLMIKENNLGWTCEPSNPEQLAILFESICNEEDSFSEVGKKSRETLIKKFSEKIILDKYEKLYRLKEE